MTFARSMLNGAALMALIALATPASAQTQSAAGTSDGGSMTGIQFGRSAVDEATEEKRREIEEAYKKVTKSTPAQTQAQAANDPWANMRGPEEHKPAAKPAAKTAQKKKPQ
jgi:hypothetical protein